MIRQGFTLIELLVTIVILAVAAGAVGLAAGGWVTTGTVDAAASLVAGARAEAIRRGEPVRIGIPRDSVAGSASGSFGSGVFMVTALPDGSVIAPPALRLDRLTGRPMRTVAR
ncbi:MAG: prepilin-type N-terminal cleavage/methylation domain-containing protein [Gemmatimonadetes bacterium]|jgi:prepilin-type N-terminal cleavage/methylation domain-containing protein|nr:prepilin-type N-terminal cleavage/methylation domain-containing protein [Gemmatimonadota bacterium]